MAVLNHLEPQRVFRFFEELCAIPHGSGTHQGRQRLAVWSSAKGSGPAVWYQDAAEQCDPHRSGTPPPGMRTAQPVILQGHMDMVCEKEPGLHQGYGRRGPGPGAGRATSCSAPRAPPWAATTALPWPWRMAVLDDETLSHPRPWRRVYHRGRGDRDAGRRRRWTCPPLQGPHGC